jgi:hypothetical protein
MHLRGTSFRVDAILPDGREQRLLEVPEWDFDWQLTYEFENPLLLEKGTRLRATGRFDNSAGNPSNPDPSQDVAWGRQTNEEMMVLRIELLRVAGG